MGLPVHILGLVTAKRDALNLSRPLAESLHAENKVNSIIFFLWVATMPKDVLKEFKEYEERFKQEKTKSDKLPKGLVLGKLVRFQVGDGYAYYKVTRVGKRTSELTWLNLHPDEWQEQTLGKKGVMSTKQLEATINYQEKLAEIFS